MHSWWPHVLSFPRFLDPISWWWLSTKGYAFTSSGEQISIPVGIGLLYWHHTCHVSRCLRLQWKETAAGDRVCRKHHPEDPKTASQVAADHYQATLDDAADATEGLSTGDEASHARTKPT